MCIFGLSLMSCFLNICITSLIFITNVQYIVQNVQQNRMLNIEKLTKIN